MQETKYVAALAAADHEIGRITRGAFGAKTPRHFIDAKIDICATLFVGFRHFGKTLVATFGTFEFPGISVARCHMPSFACALSGSSGKTAFQWRSPQVKALSAYFRPETHARDKNESGSPCRTEHPCFHRR
ncbi:hypothetical protein JZX89_02845 [Agrobacterium sp. Rnr]|uniref:Uncharacterized protein n=1 Tax=Agrobacterium burrii TaxID=2815339 RepID=A0ABS3ECI8_9HYPH|nr:hypothetical protein [Agrobacterium burrii]